MVDDEQAALMQKLKEKRQAHERLRQRRWAKKLKQRNLKRIAVLIDYNLLEQLDEYAASSGMSRSDALNTCLGGEFTHGDVAASQNWLKRGQLPTALKALKMVLNEAVNKDVEGLRAVLNE